MNSRREDWERGTVLEARRLHKEYPGVTEPVKVLCGVDLAVAAGETVVVTGANEVRDGTEVRVVAGPGAETPRTASEDSGNQAMRPAGARRGL